MKGIEPSIRIRECSEADLQELIALGKKTFVDTFADVNTKEDMDLYVSSTFNNERISAELRAPGSKFYIAEENGRTVGFCKLKNSDTPDELAHLKALEIERIYALKDQVGKGVGKAMMSHCLDYATRGQYEVVWLGVWEHNHTAINFYKKWGFDFFGQHDFLLGHDRQTDLLMKKHFN